MMSVRVHPALVLAGLVIVLAAVYRRLMRRVRTAPLLSGPPLQSSAPTTGALDSEAIRGHDPAPPSQVGQAQDFGERVDTRQQSRAPSAGRAGAGRRIGRRAPEQRGGRPREPEQPDAVARSSQPAAPCSHQPRPELVCFKRGRTWVPSLEVPDELLGQPPLAVAQDGAPLERDQRNEQCWPLQHLSGRLMVTTDGGAALAEVTLEPDVERYLLFRLSAQHHDYGRRVRRPGVGWHLIMVPQGWQPESGRSDAKAPVAESVAVDGYRAYLHDFAPSGDDRVDFRLPNGGVISIQGRAARFQLVGPHLRDASERAGPLFIEKVPLLSVREGNGWEDVGTVVIGEEGRGKGRWRTSFRPQPPVDQRLPEELCQRGAGWYFIRVYDTKGELSESLDFRLAVGLRKVEVRVPSSLPAKGGHGEACIVFRHDGGYIVELEDPATDNVHPVVEDGATRVAIPPDPQLDLLTWRLRSPKGPSVQIRTLLERVWWAAGDEGTAPDRWTDRTVACSRSDFLATSRWMLWLRLPRPRWVDEVRVGFQEVHAHRCAPRGDDPIIAIPLRGFSGSPELEWPGTATLRVWIRQGQFRDDGPLCSVRIEARCRVCGAVAPDEQTAVAHTTSEHLQDFFKPLPYEEIVRRQPGLPPRIYKCISDPSRCSFYAADDPLDNPASAIWWHLRSEHQEGQHIYIPISDAEEIRMNFNANLPDLQRCLLCREVVLRAAASPHLLQQHRLGILARYDLK